jgi:epoxyqueuosine reductase
MDEGKNILLHCCCAPCTSACLERLLNEGFNVTLFFSNSNIHPLEEYQKRLKSIENLARSYEMPLEVDVYDNTAWRVHVAGLENEPEKGKRCVKCFEFSFGRAQLMSEAMGINAFTTTLSISPHKPSPIIFEVGKAFPHFRAIDFKKKNGFQRSLELSRKHSLYRQHYCGCEFSIKRDSCV